MDNGSGSHFVLTGSAVRVFLNERLIPGLQTIQWSKSYHESPIYGIDIPVPQEIASQKLSVQGSMSGVLVLDKENWYRAEDLIPKLEKMFDAPYSTLRVEKRRTKEDLVLFPYVKIDNIAISISAQNTIKWSCSFLAIYDLEKIDRV